MSLGTCKVGLDGKDVTTEGLNRESHLGISYILLQSTATEIDKDGFLEEWVRANITEPLTKPPTTPFEPIKPRAQAKLP